LKEYIDSGILTFYRTDAPKHYRLSHSWNVAFKVATGDIVNNIDSDVLTTNFAQRINEIANQIPERAIFCKGYRSRLHGRVGFYKKDFVDLIGGFNERIYGYGNCDRDVLRRAMILDFTLCFFGTIGSHLSESGIKGYRHPNKFSNYGTTSICNNESAGFLFNRVGCALDICMGRYKANDDIHWGRATLTKNFGETIIKV
jgi:hypothetical protein